MPSWTILAIAVNVVALAFQVVKWHYDSPAASGRFFKDARATLSRLSRRIDTPLAVIVTLFNISFVLFLRATLHIGDLRSWLLGLILAWATVGYWVPVMRRRAWWERNKKTLRASVLVVTYALSALELIGFWIVSLPEWTLPFVLTCLALVMIMGLLIDSIFGRKRQRRQSASDRAV